ncbi:MAG: hypothetical protein R3358_13015, partial [Woeseiaceae bacterium]|nr:hypothetical protein [Woeseiaceae bacterium]
MSRALRIAAAFAILAAAPAFAWDSAKLANPVMINGQVVPYPVFSIFVMPGSEISAGFVDASGGATITLGGRKIDVSSSMIVAQKKPGLEVLELRNDATGETCRVNVFTMEPAKNVDADGRLNGYRIGSYPKEPLRGLDIYLQPEGFVEVTAENAGTRISPNLTLG